ncbi:MAG: mechanosensitive ion channel family protein, partial [Geminicoccaceae bacterium]
MSPIARLALSALVLVVCLSVRAETVAAAEGAEGAIVITLPADLSPEQRDALMAALGRLPQPVVVADQPPSADDDTAGGVALAIDRFDDAMVAARVIPGLIATWWVQLSGTGGMASVLAVLAGIAAVAAGLGLEYLLDRLLAGWRRTCLEARPDRFAPKLGYAFGWFGLEILGLMAFGAGALLVGWLIVPDTAIARLTLAVVVVAVIRVRLVLALAHLVFAPRTPDRRLIALSDADATLVCRWILITALVAAVAFGFRDVLAGAGVVGLAIGFGAQTLVKDVITGLFFLLEDAFRKGEYIETDAGKGVVEKISMRSVQLRHHRGPLYTIAFGQMGNVVNHSRDWVKIKFELRVPFDTDLELVRKVIKRISQEIQDDPRLGPMLLQPVKSQGVIQVDDSGFVIGVKFVSRPGQQFMVRREAYARIKQAFVENGIAFASRRVTVDSEAEGQAGRAA